MSASNELLDIAVANAPLLLPTLGYALLWLALRYVFYLVGRAFLKSRVGRKYAQDTGTAEKILEEAFAVIGSLVATVLGVLALYRSDGGGCGLRGTADCFAGWPAATGPRHAAIALYHNVELGWYLHYLAKFHLGIGVEDNAQMHVHHASTITLLLISFELNLHRIGVLVLMLLNVSNPFLHVVKVLHHAEAPLAQPFFLLFAIAFIASRIVAFPAVVLKATLFESWKANPGFLDPSRHLSVYVAANALLGLLMVLQVLWLRGILRIVFKALAGSKQEFRQESEAHDYTKEEKEREGEGEKQKGE